jgi:predicted dithiol-disulfide oxidoreductase (DUF899 family)
MGRFHDKQFPGESGAYRRARDELLDMEMDLRQRIEEVAAMRRRLPTGGPLQQDYVFEEGGADLADEKTIKQTKFSELFESGKNSLIIYSFMYAPDADEPCPMCTAILDSFNGNAPHVTDRLNLAVVAKAPVEKIRSWARTRGWNRLRLLSSGQNSYNADYFAESAEWGQMPAINVFTNDQQGIHHFYNTELLYAPTAEGQHPRHADLVWPLWNLFDLTRDGRGVDWIPRLSY